MDIACPRPAMGRLPACQTARSGRWYDQGRRFGSRRPSRPGDWRFELRGPARARSLNRTTEVSTSTLRPRAPVRATVEMPQRDVYGPQRQGQREAMGRACRARPRWLGPAREVLIAGRTSTGDVRPPAWSRQSYWKRYSRAASTVRIRERPEAPGPVAVNVSGRAVSTTTCACIVLARPGPGPRSQPVGVRSPHFRGRRRVDAHSRSREDRHFGGRRGARSPGGPFHTAGDARLQSAPLPVPASPAIASSRSPTAVEVGCEHRRSAESAGTDRQQRIGAGRKPPDGLWLARRCCAATPGTCVAVSKNGSACACRSTLRPPRSLQERRRSAP